MAGEVTLLIRAKDEVSRVFDNVRENVVRGSATISTAAGRAFDTVTGKVDAATTAVRALEQGEETLAAELRESAAAAGQLAAGLDQAADAGRKLRDEQGRFLPRGGVPAAPIGPVFGPALPPGFAPATPVAPAAPALDIAAQRQRIALLAEGALRTDTQARAVAGLVAEEQQLRAALARTDLTLEDRIRLGGNLDATRKGLSDATKGANGFAGALGNVKTVAASLGLIVTAQQVVHLAKSAIDTADAINDLHIQTGIEVGQLQALALAADQSGASLAELPGTFGRLSKAIDEAKQGSKESVDALNAIGLTARDLEGLSLDQALVKVAKGLVAVTDDATRNAAAMQLVGRSGAQSLPFFKALADDALPQLRAELAKSGALMSGETIAAADALNDRIAALKTELMGLTANAVLPSIDRMSRLNDRLRDVAETMDEKYPTVVKFHAILSKIQGLTFDGLGEIANPFGHIVGQIDRIVGAWDKFEKARDKARGGTPVQLDPVVVSTPGLKSSSAEDRIAELRTAATGGSVNALRMLTALERQYAAALRDTNLTGAARAQVARLQHDAEAALAEAKKAGTKEEKDSRDVVMDRIRLLADATKHEQTRGVALRELAQIEAREAAAVRAGTGTLEERVTHLARLGAIEDTRDALVQDRVTQLGILMQSEVSRADALATLEFMERGLTRQLEAQRAAGEDLSRTWEKLEAVRKAKGGAGTTVAPSLPVTMPKVDDGAAAMLRGIDASIAETVRTIRISVETDGVTQAVNLMQRLQGRIAAVDESGVSLQLTVEDIAATLIGGFSNAVSSAFEAFITGSQSAGAAFASAMLSAVAMAAKQLGDFFMAKSIGAFADALLGNPGGVPAGAGYLAAATAMYAISGMMSGASSNMGGGGGGGSGFLDRDRDLSNAERGTATVIWQGDKFDPKDPEQLARFQKMREEVGNRNMVIRTRGGRRGRA